MLALAFTFSMFAYWTLLGRAVVSVAYPRVGILRGWLLAPAVGVAVILLGLMVFNQAGIPIGHFASPMTIVLGIGAVGALFWRRPVTPVRKLMPFLLAILLSLLWTSWPMASYGFNWISYANDDMANYCLAAQRFMNYGFYHVPTMSDLAGRDYSAYYFFMHVSDMMRFGAEHLVAWSAAVGHLKATEAFMPAIIAFALVQVAAAGSLVLHLGRWRRRALVAMWLLAASPLFMLGTLYQLIAQVGGVALLLATIALLLRPMVTPRRRPLIRYAILPAITASALCIFYPEVTPLAALTFIAYALVWAARNKAFPSALVAIAAYTLVGVFVLLRYNIISYVSIIIVQFNGAMDPSNLLLSLFPYFMLPTGFSNFLGWMPIAYDFPEPAVSGSIALGMLLVALVLGRALRDAWKLTPAAILLLIQFAFAVRLFEGANDFGLYKLAMWMQPVLAAGIAAWILSIARRRRAAVVACLALLALSMAPTALYYTNASRGTRSGKLTELRMASRLGLGMKIHADQNAQITSTIENVVAAKLAATELRGRPLALVSRDFFWPTTRTDYGHPLWYVRLHPHFSNMAKAVPLITERNADLVTDGRLWKTLFSQPVVDRPTAFYVSVEPVLSLFNKFDLASRPETRHGVFVVEPAAAVRNRLIFVHSALGNHYYLGDRHKISFFQQEPDLYSPSHDFNGIGRFMLLRIENPSPQVYLRIAATRTFLTGHTSWSPKAVVHGESDLPLDAVGNGAFNLFIGPLKPMPFKGANYLAIDFAEFPRYLTDYRSGLKRLYNLRVPIDYRRIIGWARDVSAISAREYDAMPRPRSISNFPDELALARTLEFCGAYEDGWLSPHAEFTIAGARPGGMLRLRAQIPGIQGSTLGTGTMRVSVNGIHVCDLQAPLGTVDWLLPIPDPGPRTKIDLQFGASGILPDRDERPVGARLEYLGLAEPGPVVDCDFRGEGGPRFAAPGVDQDGWMGQHASLVLPANEHSMDVTIRFECPGWTPNGAGTLVTSVDGLEISKELRLVPGQRPTLRLRLPASPAPRTIRFVAPGAFQLPAPDLRRRSLRLLSVEVSTKSGKGSQE